LTFYELLGEPAADTAKDDGCDPTEPVVRGNRMLEMTNENFARLLRGLTIAVGNRRNRILLYQFLAAEIRALHCSYGVGDGESYKKSPNVPGKL
jgi:hypothetical protein